MPRVVSIELFELDLPFRQPFRHAAADRNRSCSLFARFLTDTGHCGYGETLPRIYVTGEERDRTFDLLAHRILPRLLDLELTSFQELHDFLARCDGKAPPEWVEHSIPQSAAWCLVDVGLLDVFARAFGVDLQQELAGPGHGGSTPWPDRLRYSVVLSGDPGLRTLTTLLKTRAYGVRDVKVKVDGGSFEGVHLARRVLGGRARLRVDSNMAWSYEEARAALTRLADFGVECFEQPLPADDVDGMARLVAETGHTIMADESLHDSSSLERLIAARACTAVNVRIAKCGGIVASLARCRRSIEAGLALQVGCQVGETSQLSAAQLLLITLTGDGIRYLEGCFGERLLLTDPVRPSLRFGRAGRPPDRPAGGGLGTRVEMATIERYGGRRIALGEPATRLKRLPENV